MGYKAQDKGLALVKRKEFFLCDRGHKGRDGATVGNFVDLMAGT